MKHRWHDLKESNGLVFDMDNEENSWSEYVFVSVCVCVCVVKILTQWIVAGSSVMDMDSEQ